MSEQLYYVHPSAYVDEPCEIGAGAKNLAFLPCHDARPAWRKL